MVIEHLVTSLYFHLAQKLQICWQSSNITINLHSFQIVCMLGLLFVNTNSIVFNYVHCNLI